VGLSAVSSGYILGATAHGDITLSGFQPLSMVVDVKNINIKGVNVVARKAAKETENERLYKAPCARAGLDFLFIYFYFIFIPRAHSKLGRVYRLNRRGLLEGRLRVPVLD
jgi:hypothetical protein